MSLRVAFDLDGTLADMEHVLRREAERMFPSTRQAEPGSLRAGPSTRQAEPGSLGSGLSTRQAESGSLRTSPSTRADAPGDAAAAADSEPLDDADANAARAIVPAIVDLTSRQWARLWAHVRRTEDFWLSLPEIDEGIVAHIAATALARRWDVIFVTTRPRSRGQTTQLQSQKWLQQHGFPFPSVFVVQRSRGLIADALELDAVVDDRLDNCVDVALESKAVPILIRPSPVEAAARESRPVGVRVVGSIREAVSVLERIDDERRQPGVVQSIKKWFSK
jgi:phosphoglycolate phosphatase-like HAD superfamily hydrolase